MNKLEEWKVCIEDKKIVKIEYNGIVVLDRDVNDNIKNIEINADNCILDKLDLLQRKIVDVVDGISMFLDE